MSGHLAWGEVLEMHQNAKFLPLESQSNAAKCLVWCVALVALVVALMDYFGLTWSQAPLPASFSHNRKGFAKESLHHGKFVVLPPLLYIWVQSMSIKIVWRYCKTCFRASFILPCEFSLVSKLEADFDGTPPFSCFITLFVGKLFAKTSIALAIHAHGENSKTKISSSLCTDQTESTGTAKYAR